VLLPVLFGLSAPAPAAQADGTPRYAVIPAPAHVEPLDGHRLLGTDTRIAAPSDPAARAVAERWAAWARRATGLPLPVETQARAGDIVLRLTETVTEPEGYQLRVTPQGIEVDARTSAGLQHALSTLRQLLPPEAEAGGPAPALGWRVPAVAIEDAPRFAYRGMHLDVSRHMSPVPFILSMLDRMALYKLNTFHWHLTDDQGWRIEIRRYPRLTEVGSTRRETMVAKSFSPYMGDRQPYGGFYTQDEIRQVVAHAAALHITVVPEIEMPGHATAALAAYPELACTPGPFEVATTWGVFEDIFCPSEATFAFLEGVLEEVVELFPGPYVHVGGDEAPKARWEASPLAQDIIRREGLADEHELQTWFINRIGRFLAARGKTVIGWDEILEGGIPSDAVVMSWRGVQGGIEAARQGHPAVMTPNTPLYFDHYQGDPRIEPLAIGGMSPIEAVYAYEPVPPELSADEARLILGAQANVWTEYIKTPWHVEYMVFPRLLALSEVIWSPQAARDWDAFLPRLLAHQTRLDALGVVYRPYRPHTP
jgi:hexosaminidase